MSAAPGTSRKSASPPRVAATRSTAWGGQAARTSRCSDRTSESASASRSTAASAFPSLTRRSSSPASARRWANATSCSCCRTASTEPRCRSVDAGGATSASSVGSQRSRPSSNDTRPPRSAAMVSSSASSGRSAAIPSSSRVESRCVRRSPAARASARRSASSSVIAWNGTSAGTRSSGRPRCRHASTRPVGTSSVTSPTPYPSALARASTSRSTSSEARVSSPANEVPTVSTSSPPERYARGSRSSVGWAQRTTVSIRSGAASRRRPRAGTARSSRTVSDPSTEVAVAAAGEGREPLTRAA